MRLKRKYVSNTIFAVLVLIFVIHAVSALTLDRSIQYKEISYVSPKIKPELDGYVVAFITDTHALPGEKLQVVVDKLNARKINLLTLGGDFPSQERAVWRTMEVLGRTKTTDGIFGVDGNHDKAWDLFAAMEEYGISPLSNNGLAIRPGFFLAGVEDLWNRRPNVPKSVANADAADFVLLLSHNPDVSMQQDMRGVDLILSGHTHGGHVTLFGLWAPRLWPKLGVWQQPVSAYGQKFMRGWAKGNNGVDVFVSRGAGPVETFPRIFARPQVIILTLYREAR